MAMCVFELCDGLSQVYLKSTKQEGDVSAQEDMLKGLPIRNKKKAISSAISKNVYKFIWAPITADAS